MLHRRHTRPLTKYEMKLSVIMRYVLTVSKLSSRTKIAEGLLYHNLNSLRSFVDEGIRGDNRLGCKLGCGRRFVGGDVGTPEIVITGICVLKSIHAAVARMNPQPAGISLVERYREGAGPFASLTGLNIRLSQIRSGCFEGRRLVNT